MRQNYLILKPAEIEKYLSDRKNIGNTKDYELAAALILIKFHVKETGEKLKLAVPVKELIKKPIRTTEDLAEFLRKKVYENHDMDVYLIPETLDLSSKAKHKVAAFQLKRFFLDGKGASKKLLQYLISDIPTKYPSKGDGILALVFRETGSFSKEDFANINSALNSITDYPFGRVMLASTTETPTLSVTLAVIFTKEFN